MTDPVVVGLGFFVGTMVGLTGVGGGSLLTPLLILVAGVRPVVAVGTDLAFAAVTKAVGAWQHTRAGGTDYHLMVRLACGSVPGALIGSRLVDAVTAADAHSADALVSHVLGVALLAAAGASVLRAFGVSWAPATPRPPRPWAAPALGFGIGVIVGLTSIGAGALLMAAFALFYGLSASRAVGTDVAHGAVLAAVAAVAHGAAGRIEFPMLANLLAGSVPGVLLGGWLCGRLPAQPVRVAIAAMLALSGLRLL